jgi:hypothetical protein
MMTSGPIAGQPPRVSGSRASTEPTLARAIAYACALALSFLSARCGGNSLPGDPGPGTAIAVLSDNALQLNLDADGTDLFATIVDLHSAAPRFAVLRARGTHVVDLPLAATDWSDYAKTPNTAIPNNTVRVQGGKAYFLGIGGVTVVPLDGSASKVLLVRVGSPPIEGNTIMGAFTVDQETIYLCYEDLLRHGAAFGRFLPDGTWEVLSSPGDSGESCFEGSVVADADSVFWSTTRAIRVFRKRDGALASAVDLSAHGLDWAPWQIQTTSTSIVWVDLTGIYAASKTATSLAGDATAIARFQSTDPFVHSLLASDDQVYWLTRTDLFRAPESGGTATLLAHRPYAPGLFLGLAALEGNLYFVASEYAASSDTFALTLRSVPQ